VKPPLLLVSVLAAALTVAAVTRAEQDTNPELFESAVAALESGALDDAIDRFELLADRGFLHPDASFDRALAYVRRAASRGVHHGDLGRATAALSEALALRPDDAEARMASERVRREIVRRRSRLGATDVDLRPSLGWAVVGLVEEETWALVAVLGSVIASLGLAVRLMTTSSAARLSGVVAASLGTVALVVTGGLTALARYERIHYRAAVVVVDEARLLDENGGAITGRGSVVPEGAGVRVIDQRGTLAHVEWGTLDGWLSLGQLRLLTRQ
jgi:hypothetical protein